MRHRDGVDWRSRIDAAAERIASYVRRTPLFRLERGAFGIDAHLFLKLEQTQHAGSFKVRGAFNRLLSLPQKPEAVVAASGGNHGAAVAHAARRLGMRAEIFSPESSSPAKHALIRSLGARLTLVGEDYATAALAAAARADELGAPNIHAYDHPDTVAGQGTLAREFEAQIFGVFHEPLDSVLVATGGGGLVGGVTAWFGRLCRVIAVEPEAAPALNEALKAGRPVDAPVGGVAADALGARRVGAWPFKVLKRDLADSVLVADAAIVTARRWLWEECRLFVEPAAAAPLAALISGSYAPARGERVGLVLCGGNAALESLA